MGSGGARGLCFAGALSVLDRSGLPIRRIIGCSMGAIIGAAYGGGVPPADIAFFLSKWRLHTLLRPDFFGPGLFSYRPLWHAVEKLIPARSFDALGTPLTVVCSDMITGRPVYFNRGELLPPVVGSGLAMTVFSPVPYGDYLLVDGGYTRPAPVPLPTGIRSTASSPSVPILNASDVVIVIDPNTDPHWNPGFSSHAFRNMFSIANLIKQQIKTADMFIHALAQSHMAQCRCTVIRPPLGDMPFTAFRRSEFAVAAGQDAMNIALPNLLKLFQYEPEGFTS